MSEFLTNDANRTERANRLKVIIDKLAAGSSPGAVKKEFHDLIKGADAAEVADLEQSLIEGGLPVSEVQRLCDVHADVFKAGLERGERAERMPGHPVHTYIMENKEARRRVRALSLASLGGSLDAVAKAVDALRPIITHFERKENQLFPYLERKGFTGPSKVMWGKHDEIRAVFKELDAGKGTAKSGEYRSKARNLARRIRAMIFMEERILFPNAIKRLSDQEWAEVRRGEDAIGFAWVRPGAEWDPSLIAYSNKKDGGSTGGPYAHFNAAIAAAGAAPDASGVPTIGKQSDNATSMGPDTLIPLSTGSLPLGILDRMLKSLPLDLSFVGEDDAVMYYSDSPHRVFPRSPAIIGRAVQNCHPPKSVHIVERIVEAFKKKEKDKAEFWIQMNGRFIVIAYKPLYDENGSYLGTLEMSADATDVRALEGQRRLLDW